MLKATHQFDSVISGSFLHHYINKQKLVRLAGVSASFVLLFLTVSTVFPFSTKKDDAEATPVPSDPPTLAMVAGHASADVDLLVNNSIGTFAQSTSDTEAEFTVTTTNLTGYTLTIAGSDNSRQLSNTITTTDKLDSITTAISSDTFSANTSAAASAYNGKWGMKPSIYNSAANTNFLQAPNTTAQTLNVTSAPNGGDSSCTNPLNTACSTHQYSISVGARADYTKPTGIYTNTFVLTAVANNVAYQINYTDASGDTSIAWAGHTNWPTTTYQEGGSNAAVSAVTLPSTTPTRTTYTFKSWCKGTVNTTTTYDSTNKIYHNPGTVCTGTEYLAGSNMPLATSDVSSTTNLYAVWAPTTFDQAYQAAGKTKESTSGYNYYKMQDMTTSICNAVTMNEITTLADVRINGGNESRENYKVIKLDDGKCWMADNMNLDLGNTTTLNSLSTTNTHVDTASLTSLKTGNRGTNARYATSGILSSGWGYWTDTNYANIPMINKSWSCAGSFSSSFACYDNTGAKTEAGGTNETVAFGSNTYGISNNKVGIYYNYCAASAGNYCYNDSGSGTPSSAGGPNADYDICPAGWRMPTGGAGVGEYKDLYDAIANNYIGPNNTDAKTATQPLSFQFKLSTPLSGDYDSGAVWSQGVEGISWSSTYYSDSTMHALRVKSNVVDTQTNAIRSIGRVVRCLAQ